jgi:glyoxylase-like metal-dependent hydrolase (beta-lactamase superfamily II)
MKLTNNLYFYPEKGMLDCNTYVFTGDLFSIIIDPGYTEFLPALIEDLHKDGIEPGDINAIVNTHLHIDHCWADEAFKKISGAKVLSHPLQKKFRDVSIAETSRFFGLQPIEFKEDGLLEDDKLNTGDLEIEFIPSPGHSPDSVCFYSKESKFLVCGDVIFSRNTGRVDLPGGDADELKQSIERLSRLEIEYLLPGHMNPVTGAKKIKDNFEFVKTHVFSWL